MKVGDMVKLHDSTRRVGSWAGKLGLIVDINENNNPVVNVDGTIRSFHITQVAQVINESR